MRDDLYQLIQRMDPSEKRLFKTQAKSGVGPNYRVGLALFNLLETMDRFDKAEVEVLLKEKQLWKNITSTKTRLFNHILQSLSARTEGKSVKGKLHQLSTHIDILIARGMFLPARKRLKKAKALAMQMEEEEIYLQLLRAEMQCLGFAPGDQPVLTLKEIEANRAQSMTRLTEKAALYALHETIRALNQNRNHGRLGKSDHTRQVQAIMESPILKAPPNKDSLLSYSYHQNIWGMRYLRTGKSAAAFQIYQKLMDRWEARTEMVEGNVSLYLGMLNNYLAASLFASKNNDNFLSSVDRIRNMTGLSAINRTKSQRIAYSHGLNFHVNFSPYDTGNAFIQETQQWLSRHLSQVSTGRQLAFYYNFATFYFLHGQYSSANQFLGQIVNAPGRNERLDLRETAQILRMFVHFELENNELAEYRLRGIRRYFVRQKRLHAFEKSLLDFFDRLRHLPFDQAARLAEFEKLLTRLEEFENRKGENPPGIALIKIWLQSKIDRVPIRKTWGKILSTQPLRS